METVHLIGAEDVIRAGHNIASAAEDMQRAADTMSCAFENQQRWMEQWLEHLEHIYLINTKSTRMTENETVSEAE